jgi:hypothetical protein
MTADQHVTDLQDIHLTPEESEAQQDEEAKDRFADESPASEPSFAAVVADPDDSPEQPNDEA